MPLPGRFTPATYCTGGRWAPGPISTEVQKISPPPGFDPRTNQNVASHIPTRLCWSTALLTLRLLMSYIYMEHPFLMFLDHTQRRTTVGRTPLDDDQLVAETSTWQHTTLTTDRYPCPRWESNPRSQQVSGRTGGMDICLLWVSCVVR